MALLAAAGAALLYFGVERVGKVGVPLALLRAASWGMAGALVVDPGCRQPGRAPVTVLLDASRSMLDASDSSRWRAAQDSARALARGGGRVLLFGGGTPRTWAPGAAPDLPTTRLLPALREAAASGGRIAIVTDGAVDDAALLPSDILAAARVVVLPRRSSADAAVADVGLPAALRAGDSVTALVDIAVLGAGPGDSALLELTEQGRVVSRLRLALAGASLRRELPFRPAPAAARSVRRYEARISGWAADGEVRNDRLATAAVVAPTSVIVAVSDAPDWDFRSVTAALDETAGVPVRGFVRLDAGGWRDMRSLRPVSEASVRGELGRAALVLAHGSPAAVQAAARESGGAAWLWPSTDPTAPPGDWYPTGNEPPSPLAQALSGVAVESLPPLERHRDLRPDTAGWSALSSQLARRGDARSLVRGGERDGRRFVETDAAGLWRWASKGGVAGEVHRAIVAATTDWLLGGGGAARLELAALRDSLRSGGAELLPRAATLQAQEGSRAAPVGERYPLRRRTWLYFAILGALVLEWVSRRRAGLR